MSYQRESFYAGRTKTGTNLSTMSISHFDAGNAMHMGIFFKNCPDNKASTQQKGKENKTEDGFSKVVGWKRASKRHHALEVNNTSSPSNPFDILQNTNEGLIKKLETQKSLEKKTMPPKKMMRPFKKWNYKMKTKD